MNAAELLQWHYMIFLLPFGVSALLLLLSSVKLGHRHGHGGHGRAGAHAGGHGARGHTPQHTAQAGRAHHSSGSAGKAGAAGKGGHRDNGAKTGKQNVAATPNLLAIIGVGRAPLPMVLQAFCMAWGISGYLANQLLLHTPTPNVIQMLPSLGIAFGGGMVGARLASELIARLMPQDETLVVSRDSLFGLVGNVAFAVSETAGRILIYDEFGSLHDETCRTAPEYPPIAKGRKAMVVDRDTQGYLIVEEIPEGVS